MNRTASSLLCFALLTLLCLCSWPYGGDQALFQLYGEAILRGDTYWLDLWDYKQPGLFWFYAATSAVIEGGLAARLAEVILLVIAAVLVCRLTRRWVSEPSSWVVPLAPWVVLGPLMLGMSQNGIGQIEGLIALPLVIQALAVDSLLDPEPSPPTFAHGLVAGVAAGVIVSLKLFYAPIALALVGGAVFLAWLSHPLQVRRFLGGFALGSVVVVALGTAVVVATGTLNVGVVTSFVLPFDVLGSGALSGGQFRMVAYAGMLYVAAFVLSLPALVAALQPGHRRERAYLLAAVVKAVNVLPQLPIPYRGLALAVPVGLLALRGVVLWRDRPERAARKAMTVAALSSVPALVLTLGDIPRALLRDGAQVTFSASRPLVQTNPEAVRLMERFTCAAPDLAPDTPAWVVGDPRVYHHLDARQAIPISGWAPEMYDPTLWAEVERELRAVQPRYLMVEDVYAHYVDAGAPGVIELIESRYQPVAPCGDDDGARWFRLAGDPPVVGADERAVRLDP